MKNEMRSEALPTARHPAVAKVFISHFNKFFDIDNDIHLGDAQFSSLKFSHRKSFPFWEFHNSSF